MKNTQLRIFLLGLAFLLIGCEETKKQPSPSDDIVEQPSDPIPDNGTDDDVIDYPEEPEEPVKATDPVYEDPEPPVEQPEEKPQPDPKEEEEEEEEEEEPQPEPVPIPDPETPDKDIPTADNPLVHNIRSKAIINFEWLPLEGAESYDLMQWTGSSYIAVERGITDTKWTELGKNEGSVIKYAIYTRIDGKNKRIGTTEVTMPIIEGLKNPVGLPERGVIPNGKVYQITIDDSAEDKTESIQEQIDNIPDGTPESYSIIQFVNPPGNILTEGVTTYGKKLSNVFNITGRSYLVLLGDKENRTSFYANDSKVTVFNIHKSNNIIFKDIDVENTHVGGYYGSRAFEHAYSSHTCANIRFENCSANKIFGDGVYAHKTNVLEIYDCDINEAGRQGAAFSDENSKIKIIDTKITNGARASVDFEPDFGGTISDVEIRNCEFDNHISAAGLGIIENVTIDNCAINSLRVYGSKPYPRKNWVVTNNTMGHYGSPKEAMSFRRLENLLFENNQLNVADSQSRVALELQKCSGDVIIRNNDFTNPSIIEIYDSGEANLILENNTPETKDKTVMAQILEVENGEVVDKPVVRRDQYIIEN